MTSALRHITFLRRLFLSTVKRRVNLRENRLHRLSFCTGIRGWICWKRNKTLCLSRFKQKALLKGATQEHLLRSHLFQSDVDYIAYASWISFTKRVISERCVSCCSTQVSLLLMFAFHKVFVKYLVNNIKI